jgi:hypothetical protein
MTKANRVEISNTINRVLAEYTPITCRFEMEEWILEILRSLKSKSQLPPDLSTTFRFKDTYTTFLPGNNLFNSTRVNEKGKVFEYTLCLKKFLNINYGVDSLTEADEVLNVSECDMELMAMQLTDFIVDFSGHPVLFFGVKPPDTSQEMSGNP